MPVRDVDSWHHGAGIIYYEPGADSTTRYRVASSVGADRVHGSSLSVGPMC